MVIVISFLIGAAIAAIATVVVQNSARNKKLGEAKAVADVISEYFQKSRVNVAVKCLADPDGKLVVLIESEPLKKFRLSYIIEQTLADHVQKTTGQKIDIIYWRFPLQDKEIAEEIKAVVAPPPKPIMEHDSYIEQGIAQVREETVYKVDEIPWENFQDELQRTDKQS
ncbi:MAG: hypothetical protein AB1513_10060 [Pseudomonadota bacterium]